MQSQNDKTNLVPILKTLEPEIIHLKADGILYKEGKTNDSVFYIHEGAIKISHNNWTIGVIQATEFIGIISLLNDINSYRFSAVAMENSTLYKFEKEKFKELLNSNNEFASEVINMFINRNRIIDTKILSLLKNSPKKRLVREIIANIKEDEGSFLLFLGKKDLKELTGISDVEIETMLSELVDRQIISLNKNNNIQVIDYKELNRLLGVDENW